MMKPFIEEQRERGQEDDDSFMLYHFVLSGTSFRGGRGGAMGRGGFA